MRALNDALSHIIDRFGDQMTDEELTAAAKLNEYAAHQAERLARVTEGIGVLLDSEAAADGNTGMFQSPEDVTELIYSIAWQCDAIAAASNIGRSARFELETRRTAAAAAEATRTAEAVERAPNVEKIPTTTTRRPKP